MKVSSGDSCDRTDQHRADQTIDAKAFAEGFNSEGWLVAEETTNP